MRPSMASYAWRSSNVAHQRAGEVVRVEIAQVVKALAHADLDDGQLKLVADGQRDAALGRAVELRDDERVQARARG